MSQPASPYQDFLEIRGGTIGYRWSEGEGEWILDEEEGENAVILVDGNGDLLFETEDADLWYTIIEHNDVALLKEYLTDYGGRWRAETYYSDPFFVAASYGSTDALRVLLEYCAASPVKIEIDDERGELLLHAACRGGHPDTVRFLLENEPVFRNIHCRIGVIHDRDRSGMTALLAAAGSSHGEKEGEYELRENAARRNELVCLLLDRGANPSDTVNRPDRQQPLGKLICTVLSQAVSWANYELVKLLIDTGAQVQTEQQYSYIQEWCNMGTGALNNVEKVTPLHISSYYSNLGGIQALLDYRGNDVSIVDMVSSPDQLGGLPLHRVAGGPGPLKGYYISCGDDLLPAPVATIKLLLSEAPNTVNSRDIQGRTPLHHAINVYSRYGSKRLDTAKVLCENGADVSLRDKRGQTPLHVLAHRAGGAESIDMVLVDLLLAYGARVDDLDTDGNTPLHFIAQRFDYIDAVQVLLRYGAKATVRNWNGDTPLHKAADGRNGLSHGQTVLDSERAQDKMIKLLQEAGGDADVMDQKNVRGKTPRQICEETRNRWLERYQKGLPLR
jgi:ankyrin repeat protein